MTGFEPLDILEGVYLCVRQLEAGRAEVENQYCRAVRRAATAPAQEIMREVFRVIRRRWRGIGEIAESGLGLADAYRDFDAETPLRAVGPHGERRSRDASAASCCCGERKPPECPAFGTRCTPEHPLGVTMVSSEGACAAYYRYRA